MEPLKSLGVGLKRLDAATPFWLYTQACLATPWLVTELRGWLPNFVACSGTKWIDRSRLQQTAAMKAFIWLRTRPTSIALSSEASRPFAAK